MDDGHGFPCFNLRTGTVRVMVVCEFRAAVQYVCVLRQLC